MNYLRKWCVTDIVKMGDEKLKTVKTIVAGLMLVGSPLLFMSDVAHCGCGGMMKDVNQLKCRTPH